MIERIQLDDYEIAIGSDIAPLQQWIEQANPSRVIVLVDENTREHCLPYLIKKLRTPSPFFIEIPAGEQHKNLDTCQIIWRKMIELDLDRQALLLNLGGGVIGDMGGFCAATYKRGIRFIQIPTTLLSQVDASIGGKLGIDFQYLKNSIGLFQNPLGVFIDPGFFDTLPERELRSGMAEVVKHSLIASKEQWKQLQQFGNWREINWSDILPDSLRVKRAIVQQDPLEKGLRKALNFGHTIGHAVESWALPGPAPLLHGEAIAIGMICESFLSHRLSGLSEPALQEITAWLLDQYGHYFLPENIDNELLAYMRKDKKNEQARINFSLLPAIGSVQIDQYPDKDLILESLNYYRGLAR